MRLIHKARFTDAAAIAQRRRTDELAKVAPMQACYYTPV
jgi:hypothetical protein